MRVWCPPCGLGETVAATPPHDAAMMLRLGDSTPGQSRRERRSCRAGAELREPRTHLRDHCQVLLPVALERLLERLRGLVAAAGGGKAIRCGNARDAPGKSTWTRSGGLRLSAPRGLSEQVRSNVPPAVTLDDVEIPRSWQLKATAETVVAAAVAPYAPRCTSSGLVPVCLPGVHSALSDKASRVTPSLASWARTRYAPPRFVADVGVVVLGAADRESHPRTSLAPDPPCARDW